MKHAHRAARTLAAVFCLAAVPLAANVSENIERVFQLETGGSVAAANVNGPILVRAADGGEVSLRAVKKAKNAECLKALTVVIDASPPAQAGKTQTLRIETKHPAKSWLQSFANGGCDENVSYELTVPRGAAVRAKSVNGAVTIENVHGGIDAETVNGRVKISGAGGAVAAKTVNGSVRADIAGEPANGKYSFKTVNGSVHVSLPAEISGKFQANTLNGAIETDFPLEVRQARHWGKKSIDARLGGGGASFSFSTVNGSIDIRKNKNKSRSKN